MIDGLAVTIPGTEVQRLLQERSVYHQMKADRYREKWEHYKQLEGEEGDAEEELPKLSSSTMDSATRAKNAMTRHENAATEYAFMAKWIDVAETYLLDTNDLHRMGVLDSRY